MNEVQSTLEIAKGISDFGLLIVVGAAFVVLSLCMMIAIFKWFKSIITTILDDNRSGLQEVRAETHKQNELLIDIAEGLRSETQLRLRNLSGFAFDLSIEQTCRLIKKVREENHIADKVATAEKIRKYLTAIHEDRNARFDTFTYRGQPLSKYCNDDWIEQVAKVVENEIYHEDGANNKRAFTNVELAYKDIKTDFYKRLNE